MLTAIAVFYRRLEIRKAIRAETDTQWQGKIVSDKTFLLLDLVVLLYGILGPGVFLIFAFVGNYAGLWWGPVFVDIPSVAAALIMATYFQVIRWENDPNRENLAPKYGGNDRLFALAFFGAFLWPFTVLFFVVAPNGSVDWISAAVIGGIPSLSSVIFFGAATTAWKW